MRELQIAALLLAAGQSRRFGGNKLHCIVNGELTMLELCARQLQRNCDNVTCIIRRDDTFSLELLQKAQVNIIHPDIDNAEFGNNIAKAVRATADADGWLIALADMPYIQAATIQSVISQLQQGNAVVVPTYKAQHGHPVGFGKAARDKLLKLNGPYGAKSVFSFFAVTELNTDDPGVLADIDTLADIQTAEA